MSWWIMLLLYSRAYGWHCIWTRWCKICYCITSCYWKLLAKYCQIITYTLFYCSTVYTVILFTLSLLHWYCYRHRIVPVIEITWILIIINNNEKLTTYTGIGEIDGGDSVCILGGPRIQVAQPRYSSTAEFRGDDWHPVLFTLLLLFIT